MLVCGELKRLTLHHKVDFRALPLWAGMIIFTIVLADAQEDPDDSICFWAENISARFSDICHV